MAAKPELRAKLLEYRGPEDVMCLHAICQSLAHEMQDCIRFQHEQLNECAVAIHYVLDRMNQDKRLRDLIGAGTETFTKLTAALASAKDRDVDAVRDHYLPGSAALHRNREEDEA